MDPEAFPLLRVTLLGSSSSGKTSIADCFVNNVQDRATPPPSTQLPRLLYRVLRLPGDGEAGSSRRVLFELEDTFAPQKENSSKSIRALADMKRKQVALPRHVRDFTPFSIWRPPINPQAENDKYRSIAHGRMGFLIVFDVNDPSSFTVASELLDLVRDFAEYRN
ncbi:Ras family protein, related, partial [Eimeria tenella]